MSEQDPFDPNAAFREEAELEIDRSVAGNFPEEGARSLNAIPLEGRAIVPFMPRDTDDLKSLVRVIVRGGCVPKGYLMKNPKPGAGQPAMVPDMSKMAVGILAGRENGLGPITSLRGIMIVNGMPSVWGQVAKGLIASKGALEDYRLFWVDERTIEEVSRKGDVAGKLKQGCIIILRYSDGSAMVAKPMSPPSDGKPWITWPVELCAVVVAKRRGNATPFIGRFSVSDAKRAGMWGNPKKFDTWGKYPRDMLEHRSAARAFDRGFADCLVGLAIRENIDEEEVHAATMLDASSLGPAQPMVQIESKPTPASEQEKLFTSLARVKSLDELAQWEMAAEGTIEWILKETKDASAIKMAVDTKRAELSPKPIDAQ